MARLLAGEFPPSSVRAGLSHSYEAKLCGLATKVCKRPARDLDVPRGAEIDWTKAVDVSLPSSPILPIVRATITLESAPITIAMNMIMINANPRLERSNLSISFALFDRLLPDPRPNWPMRMQAAGQAVGASPWQAEAEIWRQAWKSRRLNVAASFRFGALGKRCHG